MKLFTGYEDAAVREKRSLESGFACVGDSLTVQADAKDADINVIMERYARTGQVPGVSRLPSYGDFDGITDYRQAIEAVRSAEGLFMSLPAKVRARFDNDAGAFVEFCDVPENRLELADLGLLTKEAERAVREEVAKVKEKPTSGDSAVAAPASRSDTVPRSRGGSAQGDEGAR